MIAAFADGTAPRVARHKGQVAILATDEQPDDHGFLLQPAAAVELAVKLLGAVADVANANGDAKFAHDVQSIGFDVVDHGDNCEGRVTFTLNGAPLAGMLTETQVAEIAAAFIEATHYIDSRGDGPRRDGVA